MDNCSFEVGIEEFISRIPALFAYIEWNGDGVVETHVATDSPDGCYGKIVENICVPSNVRLINYMETDENEIPDSYIWTSSNTILLAENEKQVFSTNASLYLRKVLWYAYETYDEVISGAVPLDELPSFVTDDSPEYVKIVKKGLDNEPIACPGEESSYTYYVKTGVYAYYMRKDIITPCTTYSYRSLISNYYKYKDIVGENNSFIKFMNNGIGLVKVDRKLLNLTDEEKYCELPDFIYLSQVRKILSEYEYYQKTSKYYKDYYLANGKSNETLFEKSQKYIKMGGDNMTNWLKQILQKSYDVANEYKCHSDNKDFSVSFNLNLMLSEHTNVFGLNDVYINEFVPGHRYYDGDLLTYNEKTYVCLLDRVDTENPDNNYEYILKTKNSNGTIIKGLFLLSNGEYHLISEDNVEHIPDSDNPPQTVFIKDYVFYQQQYYKWAANKYEPIDVISYCTGKWDEISGTYVFDNQHFVLLSEVDGYNQWYDEVNSEGDEYRFYENMTYVPSVHDYDYIKTKEGDIFEWDEEQSKYIPITPDASDTYFYKVKENTNSKLPQLRAFKNYVNSFGSVEEPDLNEDWLYYYKKNSVSGLVVETDEVGNIIKDGKEIGTICYSLHAYGNIITDIRYNSEDNTITFDYAMGGHLLAEKAGTDTDVDGNTIFYYKNFTYDENSVDGIKFSETYYCSDKTIANLGEDFEGYVNGNVRIMAKYEYEKFPFQTVSVPTPDGIRDVKGVGVVEMPSYNDLLHSKTVPVDWMTGLYFQPKLKNNLSIDRGNGASFERHVRLGEIHSMEELESYHNGGFYSIFES